MNRSVLDRLQFATDSPAIGGLLDAKGNTVGGFTGWIGGVGQGVDLAPGAETAIDFIAGSDAFDPSDGPVLAPGTYLLVVSITVERDGRRERVVTPPLPLTLTEPQSGS